MGSYTSGMEDEQISAANATTDTRGCVSREVGPETSDLDAEESGEALPGLTDNSRIDPTDKVGNREVLRDERLFTIYVDGTGGPEVKSKETGEGTVNKLAGVEASERSGQLDILHSIGDGPPTREAEGREDREEKTVQFHSLEATESRAYSSNTMTGASGDGKHVNCTVYCKWSDAGPELQEKLPDEAHIKTVSEFALHTKVDLVPLSSSVTQNIDRNLTPSTESDHLAIHAGVDLPQLKERDHLSHQEKRDLLPPNDQDHLTHNNGGDLSFSCTGDHVILHPALSGSDHFANYTAEDLSSEKERHRFSSCSGEYVLHLIPYNGEGSPPTVFRDNHAQESLRDHQVANDFRVELAPQNDTDRPEPFSVSSLIDSSALDNVYSTDYKLCIVLTCRICLEDKSIKPLSCCKKAVCEECLKRYLSSQVQLGQVSVKCPITECNEHLEESTVVAHLPNDEVLKYRYFLELSRVDSSTKPCPQCKHFTTFKSRSTIYTPSKSESKFKIQCPACQFVWCFKCHSPWHEGVNCREYKKGDKLLRHWASEIEHGQRNAQKCPRCKIHIQRTEGCDHMTCSQCNTNFCYRCGERYRQLRFFGDHTSNLSIFGCKFRYLPERPHLRRLLRGSVCAGKILVAPVVIVLVFVLGALALGIGLIIFPFYYLCKRQRKRSQGSGRWFC
ncbi:probable E3 ubiquitin-protein ligase RNF217 [Polypterus senegalus]|uniref:probable E3 ubiquitin-protein ligase RNF217 n=1 Tax=Polypterus senegalus TaxID=55291 RepID=UPI0019652967|nr:probable E3 ubiquitin-protein ligase RNF217 [Polypterus senegalus]